VTGRSALKKMARWLLQEDKDPRNATRSASPELVVYYWDGSAPEGRHLRDISESGAYIYTPERWYLGTIVRIILQRYQTKRADGSTGPAASTCISARVVRHADDGVAVEFIFRDKDDEQTLREFLRCIPAQPARTPSPEVTPRRKGQALIEFALLVPLVFLLAVNAVNFGGFLYAWITVAAAARSGAQYMVLSSASPGPATPATQTQITNLVTNDITSLLNRSSLVVSICTNGTTAANSCTTLSDPEAPTYTLATVDVTYTYAPFIPLFAFPGMHISATLPSGTIHRKAVMRMLQ